MSRSRLTFVFIISIIVIIINLKLVGVVLGRRGVALAFDLIKLVKAKILVCLYLFDKGM